MSGELHTQVSLDPDPRKETPVPCKRRLCEPRFGLGSLNNIKNSCLCWESNNDSSRYSVTSTDPTSCDHPRRDGLCVARCGGLLAIIRNTGQLSVRTTDNSVTTETEFFKNFEWHVVSDGTVRMLSERLVEARLPPNLP
jgi:hypothetical protein